MRLLLWSPSNPLSPPKRTELPLVFQLSSAIFSTPQWDKKDRACQKQGSVFNSSMSFQTSKKPHRTKVKPGEAWLLMDNWGERRLTLDVFLGSQEVPGTWLVYILGALRPQSWCSDQGDVDSRLGGLGTVWVSPHLHASGSCARGDHTQSLEKGKNTWELHLCLGINTLWYSLYTGMYLFVHPPWVSWRHLRCLPRNHSDSLGWAWREGRQVYLVSWLQGTWTRRKANGQQVRLLLWSPSGLLSLLAESRPAPLLPALRLACFLNTSVEQERTKPARIKVVCSTLSWQL